MRLSWSQPEDLLAHELRQSRDEGRDVDAVEQRWVEAGGTAEIVRNGASDRPAEAPLRELAARLLDELDALPTPADPIERRELDEIRARGRASSPAAVGLDIDRVEGAWFGRAAGCLLGKPVEKIPPEGIREILQSQGRWPLDAYFTADGLDPDVALRWPWNRASRETSLAENIDGMPEDDDLNYTILNLGLIEKRGRGPTTEEVALAWLASLPAGRVFTAERAAYRNLLDGVAPEKCAARRNPFREWIGALIRADVFGWTAPGAPALAASSAVSDARLSHTRNGVYGAMWVAGMSAAAVVAESLDDVVDAGLSVVPEHSGLARAVRFGDALGRAGLSLDDALARLWSEFDGMHWVHVLNNAATIAWALRRGNGVFDASVPLAVMAGWDTDSDAATVGAVCGALAGRRALPERWTGPLRDRIATSLPGLHGVSITSLAARTRAVAESNERESSTHA